MKYDQLNRKRYMVAALILSREQDWQYIGGMFDTMEKAREYIKKDKDSAIPFLDYGIVEQTAQIL